MAQDTPAAGQTRSVWGHWRLLGRGWPLVYRRAHTLALALVPLELLTGGCLYLPAWHEALIPWLPLIEWVHVWAGVAFGVLLLLPVVVPLGRRAVTAVDWSVVIALGGSLCLTGLALWTGVGGLGTLVRSGALGLHGVVALLLLAWVLYHLVVHWRMARLRPAGPLQGRRRVRRRQLLRSLINGSLLGGVAALLAGMFNRLRSLRPAATAQAERTAVAAASPPPGQPLPGFQIYTVSGTFPTYEPATYRLVVDGMVAHRLELSLQELLHGLPQVQEVRNFRCVTGWEVPDVHWRGVRIAELLARAQPLPGANWLTFYSFDGVYRDSLSIPQATAPGVLLAHHADGQPLAQAQGGPLRLVVPQMYGYKSVKWLLRIEVTNHRVLGYWELRGYGPDAYLGTRDGWPPGQGPEFPW